MMKKIIEIKSKICFSYIGAISQLFILWLASCPATGQEKLQKQLQKKDYHLWGYLDVLDISSGGDWISYKKGYESGMDTLFVKKIAGNTTYALPQSYYGVFSASGWYASPTPEGLKLLHLKTGKINIIPNVKSFAFSSSGNELILLITSETTASQIKIIHPEGETKLVIPNATEFVMSPSNNKLVYSTYLDTESSLGIIEFKKKIEQSVIPLDNTTGYFHNPVWAGNEDALAFLRKRDTIPENNSLLLFNISKKKLTEFIPETSPEFPEEGYIVSNTKYNISISSGLDQIFFAFENRPVINDVSNTNVQIWNGNDKYVYPQEHISKDWNKVRLGVWRPETDEFLQVNSDKLPWVMLAGNQRFAITCDPKEYEPQFDYSGPMDFYINDLRKNQSKLLLKNHSSYMMHTLPSPGGKYIAYFRKGNWWVYDILKEEHKNITVGINVRFDNELNDMPGEVEAYGLAGWTEGDKSVLLYDQFDLWEIEPITGNYKRLTRGREESIRLRIVNMKENNHPLNFNGWYSKVIKPENGLLLQANGDEGNSGYFMWTPGLGELKMIYKSSRTDQVLQKGQTIIYREQRFDLSPRIVIYNSVERKEKVLVQSNPQQQKFDWGAVRPLTYQDSSGKTLKGFLCYPANYEPEKKYPMIVHIYQRQFRDLHVYTNPEKYPSVGFNVTNFTSQGYFVLFPDIHYDLGYTGHSAVECVISAVKKVIDSGVVDEKKIGLIGHSFGGYETDFIITQTDMFAAAVSGAAVTDLQSYYLTLNWTTGKPNIWRFENQQWRMGKSIFEDRSLYITNSPLTYAENIKTPLLSWTGQEDHQIDWHQSIQWYLALRRLNKKHILLLYPEEPHVLTKSENQADLSKRIQEWFSHFLKGVPPANWISEGLE